MVSFHFSRPSTSSFETTPSDFSDALSQTSSLDGIQNLFAFDPPQHNMDGNNDNFGAVPGGEQPCQDASPDHVQSPMENNIVDLLRLLQGLQNNGGTQRAKSAVDTATPTFRGDATDKVDCGRWVERFEREARYYELPVADWPMAAAKRFPADSSAANWVDTVFGTGLEFSAVWTDFRTDFLSHFTPPDALAVAQTNFDNLRLLPNDNITDFNSKFSELTTRLNCVLRDLGLQTLDFSTVCLAYQTKLYGPVRIHVDQYLSQRNIFNIERQRDGRQTHEVTPRELLAAAQQFASQSNHAAYYIPPPQPQPQHNPPAVNATVTPMELDTMIKERLNVLQRSGRFEGFGSGRGSSLATGKDLKSSLDGKGKGGIQCWECEGRGHVRTKCPTFLARKANQQKKSEAGKVDTQ